MELLGEREISVLVKEFTADAAVAPQSIKDIFCKAWPVAKEAIDAALKIIKNPIALAVLKVVEAIGDALSSALKCPT